MKYICIRVWNNVQHKIKRERESVRYRVKKSHDHIFLYIWKLGEG